MAVKYKLMAFDLDGTLTTSKKIISPETKKMVLEARKEGAVIVLASGRPVYGIMPLAKELELDIYGGYILAYNGGCIIDCKTMEPVYDKKVPQDLVTGICDFAKENNLAILTYEGDMIICNKDNEYVQEEARINKLPIKVIKDLSSHINFDVNKFLITEHPDTVLKYISEVKEKFSDLNVFRSAPFFMEIVPPEIDKANALEHLLNKLNLKREDLAAFGDGDNDASMIEFAGWGVAMSNASEKCKDVADEITLSNDEDGIAKSIKKMIF